MPGCHGGAGRERSVRLHGSPRKKSNQTADTGQGEDRCPESGQAGGTADDEDEGDAIDDGSWVIKQSFWCTAGIFGNDRISDNKGGEDDRGCRKKECPPAEKTGEDATEEGGACGEAHIDDCGIDADDLSPFPQGGIIRGQKWQGGGKGHRAPEPGNGHPCHQNTE